MTNRVTNGKIWIKRGEKMARYNVDHKEKMMGVRFTEECWRDLEFLSENLGLPRAKVIRRAIQELARTVRTAKIVLREG